MILIRDTDNGAVHVVHVHQAKRTMCGDKLPAGYQTTTELTTATRGELCHACTMALLDVAPVVALVADGVVVDIPDDPINRLAWDVLRDDIATAFDGVAARIAAAFAKYRGTAKWLREHDDPAGHGEPGVVAEGDTLAAGGMRDGDAPWEA